MSAFTMTVIFIITAIVSAVVWCLIPPDTKPADISDAEMVWIWKDGWVMEVYVENLDLFLGAGWRRYKDGDYVRGVGTAKIVDPVLDDGKEADNEQTTIKSDGAD